MARENREGAAMGHHWTCAEIWEAYGQLPRAEHVRLRKLAGHWKWRTDYADADDLLVTALVRLCKEGRYDKNIPLGALIYQKMRSLANSSRRGAAQRSVKIILEPGHLAVDSVESVVIDEEETFLRLTREQQAIRSIKTHFQGDPVVLQIFEGILGRIPARQVQAQTGMTVTQYNSAHRRYRRGLRALFPGWRPSND
jgi:hypothetical protein